MVVLDAAAHVATHPLDLRAVKPDFVCISFYKIFGLPTGEGCAVDYRMVR
jgi:selenocysteine lyase/cysteine desulfurase